MPPRRTGMHNWCAIPDNSHFKFILRVITDRLGTPFRQPTSHHLINTKNLFPCHKGCWYNIHLWSGTVIPNTQNCLYDVFKKKNSYSLIFILHQKITILGHNNAWSIQQNVSYHRLASILWPIPVFSTFVTDTRGGGGGREERGGFGKLFFELLGESWGQKLQRDELESEGLEELRFMQACMFLVTVTKIERA